MTYVSELDCSSTAAFIAANGWTRRNQELGGDLAAGLPYRVTRSTLAVDAYDLFDLDADQTADVYKTLLRLCRLYERDEIIIECLEDLPATDGTWQVKDSLNFIQQDVATVCRDMDLEQPRIALEKRALHFDLRIYTAFT